MMMVSILGYCLAPFVIAALINYLLRSLITFIGIAIVSGLAYFWAVKSAAGFIGSCCQPDKKYMTLFPVCIYYMFFAFYIALDD